MTRKINLSTLLIRIAETPSDKITMDVILEILQQIQVIGEKQDDNF